MSERKIGEGSPLEKADKENPPAPPEPRTPLFPGQPFFVPDEPK